MTKSNIKIKIPAETIELIIADRLFLNTSICSYPNIGSAILLEPHPEGGFYRETYRSKENIQVCGLPARFSSPRSFSTAIHFLLRSEDRSLFHRIKSDELWHFHAGSRLNIYVLQGDSLFEYRLGNRLEEGDSLQVTVAANCLVCCESCFF